MSLNDQKTDFPEKGKAPSGLKITLRVKGALKPCAIRAQQGRPVSQLSYVRSFFLTLIP